MKILVPYDHFTKCALALDLPELKLLRVRVASTCERFLSKSSQVLDNDQRMWIDHVEALAHYGIRLSTEYQKWVGHNDPLLPLFEEFRKEARMTSASPLPASLPTWFGSAQLHRSHRAALWEIDPDRYARYNRYSKDLAYAGPVFN